MLTKISALTAAVTAVVNLVTLFGWWSITDDQLAGINVAVVAVGALVHALFNPAVPWGFGTDTASE